MIYRIIRGGSFCYASGLLHSTFRIWRVPKGRNRYGSFRLIVRGKA